MIKFDFNKICKFKGKGIINLDKIKANYSLPQFTVYEPLTRRVISLDTVQSFVIYEEDAKILHSIEEQGFSLEGIDDNWWVCRRNKSKNC